MQSQIENQRSILRRSLITTDRPDSSQFVDLHIYIIPKKVWKKRLNLAENDVMQQAISAGFVHVAENLTIHELRQNIANTCGAEANFPKEFIYLRSVGRCLAAVKSNQERELKVKHYRPPMTLAPEIYILEMKQGDGPSGEEYEKNFSSLSAPMTNSQSWTGSINGYPHHSKQSQTGTSIISKSLTKLRDEQKRLYFNQQELARKRHELEYQYRKEKAATVIQGAYRRYRSRGNHHGQQSHQESEQQQGCQPEEQEDQTEEHEQKQQQEHEINPIEFGHLQPEKPKSTKQQYVEEIQLIDLVKAPNRLKELRSKRSELENDRAILRHRLKQLNAEISLRRREERDLWRKKYFIEKNTTPPLIKRDYIVSTHPTKFHIQLDNITVRLNDTAKLRRQAEYESRLLRQELQKISSNLNSLGRCRLPKGSLKSAKTEPISLHITLHY